MSAKRIVSEGSTDSPATPEDTAPEIGFGAAIRELEAILAGIEGEEVDLDRLADELKRAAGLLELCRSKIRKAEVEVTQIVQQLEAPPAE